MIRIILAFIFAPIILGVLLSALTVLRFGVGVDGFLGGLFNALIVSYIAEIVLGIPTMFMFRAWKLERWFHYALGGSILALPVSLFWFYLSQNPAMFILYFVFCGGFIGIVFWLIGVWKPKKNKKNRYQRAIVPNIVNNNNEITLWQN